MLYKILQYKGENFITISSARQSPKNGSANHSGLSENAICHILTAIAKKRNQLKLKQRKRDWAKGYFRIFRTANMLNTTSKATITTDTMRRMSMVVYVAASSATSGCAETARDVVAEESP